MDINVEGRRISIDPEWSRYRLQENLQKIGLSLTSIHAAVGQQISAIDSLAVCLIQHASNRYDGISNLDEAWDSVVSSTETKEEDWIRFRVRLEKKRQELLTLSRLDLEKVVDEVIQVLGEFKWFQLPSNRNIDFTLFTGKSKIQLEEEHGDSSDVAKCFIWYDKEAAVFNGITKWSQTFADPQVYRLALMCQLVQSLKNFFRLMLNKGNPDDDELVTRITCCLENLTNCGKKIEDHEALLLQWNCSDDGLLILMKELLNPNFVEGNNRRDEIEKELRKEFIESLEKASEEIQIERLESYEKARLEAIEKKDEAERQKRRLNSQIKDSEREIAEMERELDEEQSGTMLGRNDTPSQQPSAQLSLAAMFVLQKRDNLRRKKEKLAWDRFLSLLGRSRPRYELARQRRQHKLFDGQYDNVTDFADKILNEFVLKESFLKEGGDLSNLMSYIQHNTSDAKSEIIRLLEEMVKEPMQSTTNPTWKFDGNALVLSQILDKIKPKMPLTCEEIHICAASVIYIDCDWVTPGISLAISAPRIETVGLEKRTIDTSGRHAQKIENKDARDGIGPGVSGEDGLNGGAGQSAGHVQINCDTFHGLKLSIIARGGDGADGQNGGNGMPGSDGKDGEDAKLRPPADVNQNFSYIPLTLLKYFVPVWSVYEMSRSVVNYYQGSEFAIKYLEKGEEGESGIAGGSGGSGGSGGQGGFRGKIDIQCQSGKHLIDPVVAEDGDSGQNGTPGKGATGGKGGRNGWDAARVFTPNDLNPWFSNTGDWVEDKGNLSIEDVHCTSNNAVLGCKIVKKDQDKGVAADGQHGQNGQQSQRSEKNTAVSKKAMSKVNADWKKEESTAASLAYLEQSIRADAASLQSAEAAANRHEELSKVSAENEKRVRAAAEEEEANKQKSKHAKEMEERIKKEFQKAKKMCTAQSMQSQRTNRITDQLPNETETKEEAEEFDSTDSTIRTMPITSSDEWDSLEGVSLLDALIEKFSGDTEKSQTLSMLTQSLVLQIRQQDLWIEVTTIVRRHVDCVDDLIQSLKYINQDIELAQLFVFNKEEQHLNDLQRAVQVKTLGFNLFNDDVDKKKSTLATIYYFQQLDWTYDELVTLLKPLESFSSPEKSESNARKQLIDILGNRLVSIVASQLPGINQEKVLTNLLQCCHRNSPSPILFGTFFNNHLERELTTNTSSDQEKETTLNKFIQEKLAVRHVKDLLPSKMRAISIEQLDKLAFLLYNVKTDVDVLDDIRSRVATLLEKDKVEEKESFKSVLLLIEKAFEQFYWNHEWNEIQKMLVRFREKIQRQSTDAATISKEAAMERDAFQDSVDRLKVALTWTYCRKSYQQKLDICSELKKIFQNTGRKDLVKIALKKQFSMEKIVSFLQSIDWIKKREIDITGSFKDQGEKTDKDSFVEFVKRLLEMEPKKVDVNLMRPPLKRALHFLHHNRIVSFTAAEVTLLNKLFDKGRFGLVRDESFCRDEADLRAEYLLNWKERYFLRWTDCYAEIDRIWKKLRENWKENCINADLVAEPTKVIRQMDVLLNKYNFLTSLFLSPTESVKQWQSLSEEPPENLEQLIITRIWQDFSQIFRQLTNDVVTQIKQLSMALKLGSANQIQQITPENYQQSEKNLLQVLDSLVTVAAQCEGSENEKRLSTLMPDVELLILCQVELDGSDPARTSNIVSQLEDWKETINLMGKHRTSIENPKDDICKSLSKMLHLVLWSVTDDEYLIEELTLKDQQNRQDVERAIASLESFVGHLFMANEIEKLDTCRATVLVLKDGEDLSPWRLAFDKKQDQQLLVDKQIDIWQECVSEKKFHLLDSWNKELISKKKVSSTIKSAAVFVEVLLTSSSHSMLQLRLAVATQILDQHMKPLEDMAMLERWSGLIATISTWSEVQTNEEITSRLVAVEICLIRHLTAFIGRWLKQKKVKKSIEFNYKEIINQLSVAAHFLGQSEVQAKLLVFGGLMHLAKTNTDATRTNTDTRIDELNSLQFVAEYIRHLYSDKGAIKSYGLKKKTIIQVLYSNDDKNQQQEPVFTTLEKAYVERWLQTKTCFQSNDRIRDLYEQIQSVKKGAAKTKENRLFSSVGFELFTREEKRYIIIVGRDVAEELLRTQQPLSYMHVLKERAVQKIYQSFLKHFYPEQSTELLHRQPSTAEAQNSKSNEPVDRHDKQNCIDEFQRAFNRAHFFAKREGVEFEWLIWLQETVLRSIVSTRDQVGLALVTEILLSSIEFTPEQLFSWTTMSRPHRWIDDALVNSIINSTVQLKTKSPIRNAAGGNQLIDSLKSDLQCCLKSHQQKGRTVLKIFLRKLEQEAKLHSAGDPIDLLFVTRIVADTKALQRIDDIGRFQETSLRQWMRLIRHARLADDWPSSLTDQLTTILDRRLGHDKTDRFLQRFNLKFISESLSGNASNERNHEKILDDMLKNLSKYPWVVDQFFALANEEVGEQDDHLWEFIQNRELIEMDKENASKANLEACQIIDMMKNDISGSSAIVGGLQKQKKLVEQVKEIKLLALEGRKSWDNQTIKEWSKNRKKVSKSVRLDPADFLSVAFRAVELKEKHHLRDAQLLAILIFVSSANQQSGSQIGRRMAQISTGEGKTLITALLVVYHVLNNWSNGRRFVDIITSSSVLAEENVKEMQWFFELFGILVANNCDAACTEDESLRCKRYNSDVIYGDMSSFQRDILLSNFFSERKITGGRKTGAIVVDEVDSMLLDKGENILYLSHKIPEMDDLTQVFVEIWNAVHAPDVAMSDESAQAKVYRYIKLRLEEGEIAIPKCLDTYVNRHLLAWTRNAFRAKNLVTTKDSYKVDDVGDGRGQQIVIMDKETGVEQAQMHWSQGLHQFIQLKHTLKLSPVSLKAVFMSNIGFFKQHEGAALYGMTGTLGSTAECQLLHDVFNVDFFKMPRFKRRFCLEEDPLLASSKGKWLTNINKATQTQLDQGRAVLIVCENIAAAEAIYQKLLKSDDKAKASKIVKYVSSFDTEFQTKQRNTALGPGDVIVATNLAGRGTDFKINAQLAKNGGLHVVIGYMPPNARVEAQIEGRVARAGQPGSFQFVLCHSSVNSKEDSISELLRLKVKRDDKECRRLETIRNRGLEKIYLEEKLFDRFHQEIYNKMKKEFADHPDCEMQMKFLTNRWALWLDENAEHINNVHLKKTDNVVEKNFQNFKKDCQGLRLLPLAFALTPSELMLLGDFYETSLKVKTDVTKSGLCYDKVIKDEPNACEFALMRKVKLILQEATFDQKKQAKVSLIRVKTLIKQKMEFLTSTSELVKFTSQTNQRAGGAVPSENRFEEQITNQLSLLQIHLTAVEDILGRPVGQVLGMQFQKEEEFRELLNVIEARADLCKPYRLTKKINFTKTDSGDETICIKINQTQKTVKWPSCLDHCQTQTIHLFKAKHQKKSYAIEKKELESVIVTRDQLWETLIEEGFVGKEKIIQQQIICWANQEMDDESVKKLLDNLPKELIEYNGLLVNWLQSHEGEDYATAVGTLGLSPEHSSVLDEFLKTNKILLYVDERHGKLLKTLNFKSETDLPEKLRKHYCLLSAWTLSVDGAQMEIDDNVSREDLPCPKDSREAVDQLWNYLIEQGVIKERKIVFSHGLGSDKDKIEERKNQIKTTLDTSLSSVIDDICRKHRPVPEPVTEVSYTDIPAYLADNKMSSVVTALEFMNPYADERKLVKITDREKENMKKWKTEQQTKQHLDAYRAEVNMALEKSIGQLKTIPRVTASFQPLSKYFMSDPNTKRFPAEEIQSFQDKTFDGVITLKAVQSWGDYWDWRVFFVAMIAAAQISAGAAVIALSGGTMSVLGGALIAEGVGDMMFAIQNGVSGTFSWSSYGWNKLWSVGVTILTAGLSSYLTKGAIAGKAAMTGFQGRAGLSLFFAAAKKGLAKCGKAILSYVTGLGVDKFLTWLKTFIIENIIVHIKFLISKALFWLFDTLAEKLEQLWALMKKLGRQVGEAIGLINADLDKASTSDLCTLWGRRVVGQVASLTSSIGGCFAESGDVWKAQGTEEFKANDAVGLNSKKTSFKFVEFAKKATTVVKYLKNGAEILGLVSYAPEYVNNVNQTLDAKIRKLEDEIEIEEEKKKSTAAVQYHQIITSDSASFESEDEVESDDDDATESTMLNAAAVATERSTFNEFKEKVKGRVEGDVSKYMVDSVTRAWVQPWLQSKIEGMVEHYGEKTFQAIGSMWQGSGTSKSADQGNNKGDQQTANAENAEADAEKLKDSLGEDGCEIQKDRNGNAIVEPKTYEEVVDGIGSGKTAGLLEMQMIADALNCKLEIVDTVGDFAKNGSGSFEIDPEGKATGTIQVKYTANEDGTKHVTLIGPDGKEINLPPAVDANGQPAPPNRCLYDAVAKAQNCSTDQLLDQVKTHATGNKMARYLYDEKVGEACPGLRVGNRTRKEGSIPADIYLHRDEEGTVRTVAASVTKENIGGGSNVTNSMYKALNDAGRKGEPNTTADENNTDQNDQQKYHAGHVIGFESGGKGGLKENNVVNMAAELNLGPYKELETEFRKLVEVSDGPVHINIDIDEDIPSKDVDPLNPKHFRIRWSSDDGKTVYRSPLLKNTKEGVQECKDTPRAERDEYFQGEYFEDQRSQQKLVKNNPKPPEKPILVAQPGASPNDTIIGSIYAEGKKETEDTKFKGSLLRSNIKYPQPVNTTKSGTGKNTKPIGAASSTSGESLKATPQKRRDMQPVEDGVKRLQQ